MCFAVIVCEPKLSSLTHKRQTVSQEYYIIHVQQTEYCSGFVMTEEQVILCMSVILQRIALTIILKVEQALHLLTLM